MADDKYDRLIQKAKDGDRLTSNEEHDLKRVGREESPRGRDYRAWKNGNK